MAASTACAGRCAASRSRRCSSSTTTRTTRSSRAMRKISCEGVVLHRLSAVFLTLVTAPDRDLETRVKVGFLEHVFYVLLHRAFCNVKATRDGLVRQTLDDEIDNLPLAVGESGVGQMPLLALRAHQLVDQLLGKTEIAL